MKIDVLSFSRAGGAGRVSARLSRAYNELGHESNFLSLSNGPLRGSGSQNLDLKLAAIIDNAIMKKDLSQPLFSALRSKIEHHPKSLAKNLHIRWPWGFVEPLELARNHNVIWTLPDERAFTGGCHYSKGCDGFFTGCKSCPKVRFGQKLIASNVQRSIQQINEKDVKIKIVTPSDWLRGQAEASLIFRDFEILTIPNPIGEEFTAIRGVVPKRGKVRRVVIVAEDLDDPVKGVEELISAIDAQNIDQETITAVLVGSTRKEWPSWVTLRGQCTSEEILKICLDGDLLVVNSKAEAAGMVVAEAAAAGIAAAIRRTDGLVNMLPSDSAFFYNTLSELMNFLRTVDLENMHHQRIRAQEYAQKRYELHNVAKKYLSLFQELSHVHD